MQRTMPARVFLRCLSLLCAKEREAFPQATDKASVFTTELLIRMQSGTGLSRSRGRLTRRLLRTITRSLTASGGAARL